jgi:transketolase
MSCDLAYVPLTEFQRLRSLPADDVARVSLFATACRLNALYAIKRAGSGHIGSSFSSLDLVAWLYLVEMREEDVYFSSKGHDVPGLYAVLTALGRLDFSLLHRLRRLGGLPGHPDVSVPGIAANTGSLGMGISKAKGMVLANRLDKKPGRVFVLLGDGELQEGQIWESLPQAVQRRMGEITVLVDANKIQSDLWVSKVSEMGDLVVKARAFGWHAERVEGHDLTQVRALFERLRSVPDRPKFIVADTIKGCGVSFMEGMGADERLYHYHSGAPGDVEYEKAVAELTARLNDGLRALGQPPVGLERSPQSPRPPVGKAQNLLASYGRELSAQAEKNPRLVVLDADLAKDCALLPFEKKFPERFVECGIAEQDMVSQAGGLARRGFLPVVHSFSCFLSARPQEQIYNNALEKNKILYVGSLAGFLPAGPGTSHQAVRDISTLGAVPGLILIEPSCSEELARLWDWAVNESPESAYFRLVSVSCDVPFSWPDSYTVRPGRGWEVHPGDEAVLFAAGPLLLTQAHEAARRLGERGVRLRVVAFPWLNRVDGPWLKEAVGGCRAVFTLDNHYLAGGMGERIFAALLEQGVGSLRAKRFGLDRPPFCGAYDEVLQAHRLDAAGLAEDIATVLEEKHRPTAPASRVLSSVADSDVG